MPAVLVLSYYFPPSGGSGVQRVLKFVKHLPVLGWTPVVVMSMAIGTSRVGNGSRTRDPRS